MQISFKKVKVFYNKIALAAEEQAKSSENQMIPFGLFGAIAYPLFYLINVYLLTSQAYVNLSTRIVASILCIPLILKNYWPENLRRYLPFYWYLTVLYVLPFFTSYNLFQNHASVAWLMNLLAIMILMMLLLDWFTYAILLSLGSLFGWLTYYLTTSTPFKFEPGTITYLDIITTYSVSLIMGVIFSRNKEEIAKEKLQTIKTIGASIAHELRTPLRIISSAAHGMKRHFPILLNAYQLAKKEQLPIQYISLQRYEILLTACDDIEAETEAAFTVINMLLMNVTSSSNTKELKTCSITYCIDEALRRYPFNIGEAEFVHWKHENDFFFKGSELLIIHVLFNLLKNALYYIKEAHKGDIQIWTERGTKYNLLHFKDTGKGISAKVLPHIFDRFFTRTYHGAGIGLAFCKMVMDNLGGKILVQSKEGEYVEFILYFPHDPVLIEEIESKTE